MNLTTTSSNARLKLAQNRSCPAIRIFTASGDKGTPGSSRSRTCWISFRGRVGGVRGRNRLERTGRVCDDLRTLPSRCDAPGIAIRTTRRIYREYLPPLFGSNPTRRGVPRRDRFICRRQLRIWTIHTRASFRYPYTSFFARAITRLSECLAGSRERHFKWKSDDDHGNAENSALPRLPQ